MTFKLLICVVLTFALFSCSKENVEPRDLDISVELKSELTSITSSQEPWFYPNPFDNVVSLTMDDNTDFILNINSVDGKTKLELSGGTFMIDFSKESSGTYNCEILVNGKVYKTLLIKN